jgi:type II secretory pathway pseudopilin PulG
MPLHNTMQKLEQPERQKGMNRNIASAGACANTPIARYASTPWPRRSSVGAGFTLVELALVIVIIGLAVGSLVPFLTAQQASARLSTTKMRQETIKSALINFIARNNRLPCPALASATPGQPTYGVEAASVAGPPVIPCGTATVLGASVRGIVPFRSLGLSDESALDGYNRRFTYQVTMTQTSAALTAETVAGMRGTISVHSDAPPVGGLPATGNQINACSTNAADNKCNIRAVAVILSHGENGIGGYLSSGTQIVPPATTSARELQNAAPAGALESFIQAEFSTKDANRFDDVVMALAPDDLLSPLTRTGALKSDRTLVNDKIARLKNAMIGYLVSKGAKDDDYCDFLQAGGFFFPNTLGLTSDAATDPWGNAIIYDASKCAYGGGPPIIAFELKLNNPPVNIPLPAPVTKNDISYLLK